MTDRKSFFVTIASNQPHGSGYFEVKGKHQHLGTFDTPEEAHQAYIKAKRELHSFNTL